MGCGKLVRMLTSEDVFATQCKEVFVSTSYLFRFWSDTHLTVLHFNCLICLSCMVLYSVCVFQSNWYWVIVTSVSCLSHLVSLYQAAITGSLPDWTGATYRSDIYEVCGATIGLFINQIGWNLLPLLKGQLKLDGASEWSIPPLYSNSNWQPLIGNLLLQASARHGFARILQKSLVLLSYYRPFCLAAAHYASPLSSLSLNNNLISFQISVFRKQCWQVHRLSLWWKSRMRGCILGSKQWNTTFIPYRQRKKHT